MQVWIHCKEGTPALFEAAMIGADQKQTNKQKRELSMRSTQNFTRVTTCFLMGQCNKAYAALCILRTYSGRG